ncbi:MAG: hypothetical protein Q8N87_03920 [bacterium]|nr:hypothetical protein [bacterium]
MKNQIINQKGIAPIAIILIIIGVLVIVGGIYFVSQKFLKPVEPSEQQIKEEDEKPETSLELIIPKDTYKVGEQLTNEKYVLTYKGEAFKGIILYRRLLSLEVSGSDILVKTIESGTTELPFLNFSGGTEKISEGHFRLTPHSDTFNQADKFEYITSVYKCSDLGLSEEKCSEETPVDLILKFEPIASVSKTITVIKDVSVPTEKTVLDCDVKDPKYGECTYKFLDLFEENLKLCKPSKGTTPIGWEPAMGIFRGYEIVGIEDNLCVVDFTFLKTTEIPDTLLNKKMVCKYSVSERTIEKVAGIENCTGPLYDELNKLLEEE